MFLMTTTVVRCDFYHPNTARAYCRVHLFLVILLMTGCHCMRMAYCCNFSWVNCYNVRALTSLSHDKKKKKEKRNPSGFVCAIPWDEFKNIRIAVKMLLRAAALLFATLMTHSFLFGTGPLVLNFPAARMKHSHLQYFSVIMHHQKNTFLSQWLY